MSEFPKDVRELEDWVPHRPPMRWIDKVLWADATEGECQVSLKPDGLYWNGNTVRPSSMIEWIAQGYAFVRAAQIKSGLVTVAKQPKRAFLVAVQNAEYIYLKNSIALDGLNSLRVKVRHERDFGPLALLQGSVLAEDGSVLATAKLKVFGE